MSRPISPTHARRSPDGTIHTEGPGFREKYWESPDGLYDVYELEQVVSSDDESLPQSVRAYTLTPPPPITHEDIPIDPNMVIQHPRLQELRANAGRAFYDAQNVADHERSKKEAKERGRSPSPSRGPSPSRAPSPLPLPFTNNGQPQQQAQVLPKPILPPNAPGWTTAPLNTGRTSPTPNGRPISPLRSPGGSSYDNYTRPVGYNSIPSPQINLSPRPFYEPSRRTPPMSSPITAPIRSVSPTGFTPYVASTNRANPTTPPFNNNRMYPSSPSNFPPRPVSPLSGSSPRFSGLSNPSPNQPSPSFNYGNRGGHYIRPVSPLNASPQMRSSSPPAGGSPFAFKPANHNSPHWPRNSYAR